MKDIADFAIIERLDETHSGKTQITLGKYNKEILVCKVKGLYILGHL